METIKELKAEMENNHKYPDLDIACIKKQALEDVIKLIDELNYGYYFTMGGLSRIKNELKIRIEG